MCNDDSLNDDSFDLNTKTDAASNNADSKKITYKDRKLEHKLKKYEAMIKNCDNIHRIGDFLFIGNCGLNNNISCSFLEETFSKFGELIDIVMPKNKSYSFAIYQNPDSTTRAIETLQAQVITTNQTPICFYLFPVDKVPEKSENITDFVELNSFPEGFSYLENYIDADYASKLVDFLTSTNTFDLKKRKVKHFGYEFRYGSNDCDEKQPLAEKIPEICQELIKKMLDEKLIEIEPDQLTVNFYEPGHGIAPHVDNPNAFDECIISLSLLSSATMELRQRENKQIANVYLRPNSLVVMKGDARYKWTHSISERKHDLVLNSNQKYSVVPREKRISLTFRKLSSGQGKQKSSSKTEPELTLPKSELEALTFEKSYVHTVYDKIADHFSSTRHAAWPGVAKFIQSMEAYAFMLDVGCGNGKYLNLRQDLFAFGCDYSSELIKICQERKFNCFVSDCLSIPARNDCFDYVICIAVIHHLSTRERRIKAINEINRILKLGGRALITVWAKEQKYESKDSFYITKRGGNKDSEEKEIENEDNTNKDSNLHNFGKEFQKKDLFVTWRYNPKTSKNEKKKPEGSELHEHQQQTFLRYYHIFEKNELENLFESIPNTQMAESFYEQGNWCVIFEKI